MEFEIAKSKLVSALTDAMRGYKEGSETPAELVVDQSQLTISLARRIVQAPVKALSFGAARLPIHQIFWLKRVLSEASAELVEVKINHGIVSTLEMMPNHNSQGRIVVITSVG